MFLKLWKDTARLLAFVRFSHTIFALPFALGSMLVAARSEGGWPSLRLVGLILLCMVFARTAAMLFNRVADWEMDRRNPRTAARHTLLGRSTATVVLVVCSAAFVATTWWINPLCFWLSPVALAIVFLYSLTKRFTHFTQIFLGLALAVSPVGAWLAVTGAWAWPPLILAAGVLSWVAGFDLIYATQDVEFDRKEGVHSMVVWLGVDRALWLALLFHVAMWLLLGAFAVAAGLGPIFGVALLLIAGILFYEHRIAATRDLVRINDAFFKANALVGLIFVSAILLEMTLLG
jgi:4-hydroxybenzoate polyprenyltransferase